MLGAARQHSCASDSGVPLAAAPQRASLVVVVDDDGALRHALSAALVKLGYRVVEASDGEGALATMNNVQPDLVLLDVVLPGIDGIQVCRTIRGNPPTRLLPVVLLTGSAGRDARIEGLNAGASDFLTKPFDLSELEIRIRNLIAAHQMVRELDSVEQILCSIALAVEARDRSTGDHCERLSMLAHRFGQRLGLGEPQLLTLRRAGHLHDIGKIGVPDAVLLKPGPLDKEEWLVMRSHAEIGARICAPLRSLQEVVPVVRHHHERWNGSGYPDGLSGEAIPFLARVFQLADAYDALVHDRCYRRALIPDEASGLMRGESSRGAWDPELTARFCDFVADSGQ